MQKHYEVIYLFVISAITCQFPSDHINSSIAYQAGNAVGDVIYYNCDNGYHLTSGSLFRACKLNGMWDGSPPICSREYS